MTQTLESSTCTTLAQRQVLPTAPILIRVPTIAATTISGARPLVRRRLRRELRVASYWMLALIPPSVACVTWGGTRSNLVLAVNFPDRADSVDIRQPSISLSLAPALAVTSSETAECSVSLSGRLLPLDASEELTHGGY